MGEEPANGAQPGERQPPDTTTQTDGVRVLHAGEAFWRPSNQLGVWNTDLAGQLGAEWMGARLWRLGPGQFSTRHRHQEQAECYLLLEGTGRLRAGEELFTLEPQSVVTVEPGVVRQVFNDTDADALWLVFGAPKEHIDPGAMTDEVFTFMYPYGPKAPPPELAG